MNGLTKFAARSATKLNIALYRSSKGRLMGKVKGFPILLLTVDGRRSGQPRTTPLGYLQDDGRLVVIGSAGGQADEPQWFKNLRATDHALVEVNGHQSPVRVTIADSAERDVLWQKLRQVAPFYEKYQTKTDRVIPLAILQPR